jgi:ribosome-binding factor A
VNERKAPDPATFAVLRTVTETLQPLTRMQQMRVMASTCILTGDYSYARMFLGMLEDDDRDEKKRLAAEAAKAEAGPTGGKADG